MRRVAPSRSARRSPRSGAAVAIVLVLIGVFGLICQTLTMLVAIQHRQALHHADQAQARRLAEAGLLRATAALEQDAQWSGDTWTPSLPAGSAAVRIIVTREAATVRIQAAASLTTPGGRIHKSNQTLDVPQASSREVSEGNTR